MTDHKVPVYATNDLKSTSDDALLPYLTNLPAPYTFTADHTKSNIRFLLGYSAVAIAAFTFYADRKLGWEATTSPWIIIAVVTYFALNSALTFWMWAVEAGEVFNGKRKSGETVSVIWTVWALQKTKKDADDIPCERKISISTSAQKHSVLYKVHIVYKSPTGKVLQDKKLEAPFTKWFSADGIFHPEPFRKWLAGEVDVLRLAAKENEKRLGGASAVVSN
ncbi:hypothetical protein N7539_008334 [Penicillium diatomitis]|uniref:Signal peptidase complex subunit 2 n=1 Tax=Penicillium diatomitis TaxID=2819901 RepID=A0A9W9WU26_9EURO|nr:uncharacterized protein N7539_008334 [Penicillium diatomitis]KAJ5475268.1 hypothetical protein N7539_008334 [Penicillium diatomitis]